MAIIFVGIDQKHRVLDVEDQPAHHESHQAGYLDKMGKPL